MLVHSAIFATKYLTVFADFIYTPLIFLEQRRRRFHLHPTRSTTRWAPASLRAGMKRAADKPIQSVHGRGCDLAPGAECRVAVTTGVTIAVSKLVSEIFRRQALLQL